MWVKATPAGGVLTLEYAGLARGEDPTLAAAVESLAAKHGEALETDGIGRTPDSPEPAGPGDRA